MSFVFETRFPQHLTAYAGTKAPLWHNNTDCWIKRDKKSDGKPGER